MNVWYEGRKEEKRRREKRAREYINEWEIQREREREGMGGIGGEEGASSTSSRLPDLFFQNINYYLAARHRGRSTDVF